MTRRFKRIAFTASDATEARRALKRLTARYGSVSVAEADVIVALGGDGLMLATLHEVMAQGLPVYGMNRGSVGFLMNEYTEDDLIGRLEASVDTVINPLRMTACTRSGETIHALGINEVSLLRETRQATKIRISIDGSVRMEELICDGVLIATPAGSTAYNLSAHGPILPIDAELLAVTPISAFRPRRWRGALLPKQAVVRFDVLEPVKRPVSAVADAVEVRDVDWVEAQVARDVSLRLLFDPGHNLDERILREQFAS